MGRPRSRVLTENELDVMRVVWRHGEVTVHDVVAALEPQRKLAYNTVLTTLRKLRDKGSLVSRREARRDIFRAAVSEGEAQVSALKYMLRTFFAGSTSLLAQRLIAEQDLSDEDWQALWDLAQEISEDS